MKPKTTHGGRRPGAGRPKGTGKPWPDEQKRHMVYARLPYDMVAWIKQQPETMTQIIEKAVQRLKEEKK